jgi:tungstate transport system substrate-binding protein
MSGLLSTLLPDFEVQTGCRVEVMVSTQNIYDIAGTGVADLVISHYGFPGLDQFVLGGLGDWPRPIFASQAVVLGPASDPAQVAGAPDAIEAFRRIAATQSLYVVNNDPNVKALTAFLWEAAGRPDPGTWYSDTALEGGDAADSAAMLGGYLIWGVDPFFQYQKMHGQALNILFSSDSVLQRIMIATVVTTKTSPNVNVQGANALRDYLLSAAVQARVRAFRYQSLDQQFWWPAAQNN